MDAKQEQELRNQVSDLVMDWHEQAVGVSVDDADAKHFQGLIRAADAVADESEKLVRDWVGSGKRAGLTWADIGAVMGISRQALRRRSSVIKQYEDEGWTHAFTWSPFVYFLRRGTS